MLSLNHILYLRNLMPFLNKMPLFLTLVSSGAPLPPLRLISHVLAHTHKCSHFLARPRTSSHVLTLSHHCTVFLRRFSSPPAVWSHCAHKIPLAYHVGPDALLIPHRTVLPIRTLHPSHNLHLSPPTIQQALCNTTSLRITTPSVTSLAL